MGVPVKLGAGGAEKIIEIQVDGGRECGAAEERGEREGIGGGAGDLGMMK